MSKNHTTKFRRWTAVFISAAVMAALTLTACSGSEGSWDSTPKVLTPSPDGTVVYDGGVAVIDASHSDQGYIMINYTGTSDQPKARISCPGGMLYTYDIGSDWRSFPLTGGNGTYTVTIYEHAYADQYTTAFSQSIDVTITNENGPYLYPNYYVQFDSDSQAVAKGQELAQGAGSDLDVVRKVYEYVTENISYDNDKAASVTTDYVPNVDEVLSSGKGICFDYAALTAAMLRSQNIPTKVEVGYSGNVYHAWVSVYTQDSGWVDRVIHFDGNGWSLMDPTFGASNSKKATKKQVNNSSNYQVQLIY